MPNKPKTKKRNSKKVNRNKNVPNNVNRTRKDTFNIDEEIIIGITPKTVNNINQKNNKKVSNKSKTARNKPIKKKNKTKKSINTKLIKAILKIMCLIFIIIGTIAFLMISPIFNIAEIEIENNKKLSQNTYVSLSGIKQGENIYRISKKEIIGKIKENAYVENVKIKRVIPNKIKIEVQERTATYMIKIANSYMYIDNQGYMLEVSQDKLEVPILIGIKTKEEDIKVNNRLCEEDLDKLNKVLEIYKTASSIEIDKLISQIDISDKSNYKLILDSEKKNVYLGDATDLLNKFTWIKKTLETEKGKKGDIYANRDLNSQPVYFSPSK